MNARLGGATLGVVMTVLLSACASNGSVYNDGLSGSETENCKDVPNSESANCMGRLSVSHMDQDKFWEEFWIEISSYD